MRSPYLYSMLIACCLLLTAPINAQTPSTKYEVGVADAEAIEGFMPPIGGFSNQFYSSARRISLRNLMMPIRKVELGDSLWSYSLASCLEYFVNLQTNYKRNLSPSFITLSLAAEDQNLSIVGGLKFLVKTGTVESSIVPYGTQAIPSTAADAPRFLISNFLILFSERTRSRRKVFEIRKALQRGYPIIAELEMPYDLYRYGFLGEGVPEFAEELTRRYNLLITGFDEDAEVVEVMSHWGRDWGEFGYAQVPYEILLKYLREGYVLIPSN